MNNFFYDLNKRLATLADKQDATQLAESKQAETVAKSPLTQALNEGQAKRLPGLPITRKDVEKKFGGSAVKMAQSAKKAGFSDARIRQAMDDLHQGKNPNDVAEAGYSAKAGRAGKDLGKPGKNFSKIAKGAAERYGSKAAGERVAGAVLNKLRHPKEEKEMDESALQAYLGKKKYGNEGMKALQKAGRDHAGKEKMAKIRAQYDKMDEEMADEGNAFTGKLASTPKGGKFKVGGKEFKDTSSIEEGACPACDCAPCKCNEGNAFTGKLKATPKGEKFKLGNKTFKDTSEIEEGFKEMDAWLASREKEKGTGKFDRKERTLPGGMKATTYTRKHEDDAEDDSDAPEAKGGAPKKKGRPKGKDKGPERVTKGAWKHKGARKEKTKEGLDSDGVMMTRPTNCSSESIEHGEQAEYNDEAGMTKDSLHTIVRHARELEKCLRQNENLPEWVQEKVGQIKGMMSSVTDYILSTHERDAEQHTGREGITMVPEKAVSKAQRKFMGMAHAIQKGERIKGASPELKKVAKTMKPSDTHDFAATKEKGLPKKVKKTEEGAKPDFLDVDKDGNKKETFKKAVADKKEEKVDETTVAGSVATASPSGKSSKGGMQFGKGVYEGFNNQVESMITESINVADTIAENEGKTITVTASGPEADMLMQLLKAAGLSGQSSGCGCGQTPCACEETVDEAYGDTDETLNNPDWPTDKETLAAQPELRTYSGGLNGPKSTGQSTTPVLASQLRRQASMEESVELERTLFKTWKNYKG